MKKWISMFLLASASMCIIPAFAQKPAVITNDKAGWHKIGENSVSFQSEKDEIMVLGKDKFKALRILVKYQPIYISSMVVYYEGGLTEDIAVNAEMKSGVESAVFNLKNKDKEISKITFVYKTASNAADEKAHVEIYGQK